MTLPLLLITANFGGITKGRWIDNVFIERLWKSLKYECVYIQEFDSYQEAKKSIGDWINFYNYIRPHSVFDGQTPGEVYNRNTQNCGKNLAA